MKKVLAFVLVLAMVLGSVSMAFAATKDYKDQAQITNTEAVAVLSALKVLEGDANGFRPKDTLTRAEAAAIIARLALGREDADKLSASGALFTDVPATHWAAGYIAYCVSQGIIAGNGDGTFTPEGVLTVSAFTKMLLCVLGYNAQTEGLVGSNWEANTTALAVKANISVSATGACTRETAAQLGLNTLEADTVEYKQGSVTVNAGGAQVVVGGSSASKIAAPGAPADTYQYNATADGVQHLAEKVFKNDLKKSAAKAIGNNGSYGYEWTYKNDEVAVGKGSPIATFTANTSAKNVFNQIKNYKINGVKITDATTALATWGAITGALPAAGALTNPAIKISELTGNGTVVKVYADKNNEIVAVAQVVEVAAKVNSVSTNKAGDVTYTFTNITPVAPVGSLHDYAEETAKADTIIADGTLAKGDYVTLVAGVEPNADNTAYWFAYPTTLVNGVLSAVSGAAGNQTLTIDGTTYKTGVNTLGLGALTPTTKTAKFYVDQYGYVVYTDGSATYDYAVVNRIAAKDSASAGSTADGGLNVEAQLVMLDGTTKTVKVAQITNGNAAYKKASMAAVAGNYAEVVGTSLSISTNYVSNAAIENTLVGYEVNGDGEYELAYTEATSVDVAAATTAYVTRKNYTAFGAGGTANLETVFIVKDFKSDGKTEKFTVYTGYKEVPTIQVANTNPNAVSVNYVTKSGKTYAAFVDKTAAYGHTSDGSSEKQFFYATSGKTTSKDGDTTLYSWSGYLDGEKTTVYSKSSTLAMASGNLYALEFDENNYASSVSGGAALVPVKVTDSTIKYVDDDVFEGYSVTATSKVYVFDEDKNLEEGAGIAAAVADEDAFFLIYDKDKTYQIKALYIFDCNGVANEAAYAPGAAVVGN